MVKEEDEFVEQFEETIKESTDDQAVVEELNNNDEISVEILILNPKLISYQDIYFSPMIAPIICCKRKLSPCGFQIIKVHTRRFKISCIF